MYSDAVGTDPGMLIILIPLAIYWGYKQGGLQGIFKTLAAIVAIYLAFMFFLIIGITAIGFLIEYLGPILIGLLIFGLIAGRK